jgi:hypothetical protein
MKVGDSWAPGLGQIAFGLWHYGVPIDLRAERSADATRALAERQAA